MEPRAYIPVYPHPDTKALKTPCIGKLPQDQLPQRHPRAGPIRHPLRPVENVYEFKASLSVIDTRRRVNQTSDWPNSVHGIVAVDFENTRYWGTGIMIGPNIVLTAAHNLYNYKRKTYANLETMQFLPAVNGPHAPFDFVEVEQYCISPNYIAKEIEDFAIIILKEPIGYFTGYFGLCPEPTDPESEDIMINGYPYDKVRNQPNTYEMWTSQGEIGSIDLAQGIISHIISVSSGQSGSGIYYKKEEKDEEKEEEKGERKEEEKKKEDLYYVFGVHIKSGHTGQIATLLTKACYKQIYEWLGKSRFCGNLFSLGKPDLPQPRAYIPVYPHPDVEGLKTPCIGPVLPIKPLSRRHESQRPLKPLKFERHHQDSRELVDPTDIWPNSVHGMVAVDFENERCWGTGIMIGPNIVLTAAHNMYKKNGSISANLEMMQFLPAINGQHLPFPFVKVEECFISKKYTKSKDIESNNIESMKEDFAILTLKEPIGFYTGYFGLCPDSKEPERTGNCYIYGYPSDQVQKNPNTYQMWKAEGGALKEKNGIIDHVISSSHGQSGSGIWYIKDGNYYVFAVHIAGVRKGLGKKAISLTKSCYRQIYEWLGESRFCGSLFKLQEKPALIKYDLNSDLTNTEFGFDN